MFRNILVAIDGSAEAAAALEEAIELARRDGARLVLITVAAPPRWRFSGLQYVPYPSDQELEHAAQEVVTRAERLVPPDIPVASVVRVGRPAAEIVTRAERGGHDLVVIGSRRLGVLGSLLLGSVGRSVAARCPVPVLVAGSPRGDDRNNAAAAAGVRVERERPGTAMSMNAEPATKGEAALFLWLLAALLVELELVLWMFNGTYAE